MKKRVIHFVIIMFVTFVPKVNTTNKTFTYGELASVFSFLLKV